MKTHCVCSDKPLHFRKLHLLYGRSDDMFEIDQRLHRFLSFVSVYSRQLRSCKAEMTVCNLDDRRQ